MNGRKYKVTEDIGTEHESVSYFDSYESACRYCRGLYNTLYSISENKECDGNDAG